MKINIIFVVLSVKVIQRERLWLMLLNVWHEHTYFMMKNIDVRKEEKTMSLIYFPFKGFRYL